MKTFTRLALLFSLLLAGIWFLTLSRAPDPEGIQRFTALQSLASMHTAGRADAAPESGFVAPVSLNLAELPAPFYDPTTDPYQQWLAGEVDFEFESILPPALVEQMRAEALKLPASPAAPLAPGASAPVAGLSFEGLDYLDCCGGGGNVPPDPEMAAGPNHVIAVVNTAFKIFHKNGALVVGPTTLGSFYSGLSSSCTGHAFDPNVVYDEKADRWLIGADGDGVSYCAGVSQSSDPTGSWWLYEFPTNVNGNFFDYPHLGVGEDAFYLGANMFAGSYAEARIWAFDKAAMYAGSHAAYTSRSVGGDDTPQPLNLHGWNDGSWPAANEPHYILTSRNFNGRTFQLYSWDDPFGANQFSSLVTLNVQALHGVTVGMPISNPQPTGRLLAGNDFRPQDFEFRNGYGWMANTVSCNPGSGTVNCIQFGQIDLANRSVAQAGVYATNGQYRYFGDTAANRCDEALLGYTKSSSALYPGVYVSGPVAGATGIQTPSELLLHQDGVEYANPYDRWGDYTGMTIDPDGLTFWYLGEYSKNLQNVWANWGTWIGSFTTATCSGGTNLPPTVNIVAPANASTVSGIVLVQIDASDAEDPAGALTVEWNVDGGAWQATTYSGGSGTYEAVWDTTGVADGAHVVNARATDSAANTSSDANNVTVDNVADPTIHVGDLNPYRTLASRGRWNAHVDILVVDAGLNPITGATVTGAWSSGATGTDTCTTVAGVCTITKSSLKSNVASVLFTVTNVSHGSYIYDPTANVETSVTVYKDPPPPVGGDPMHVGDLDGLGSPGSRPNRWDAHVDILVHDEGEVALPGVTVSGTFSSGGSGSCTTLANGYCQITNANLKSSVTTTTFAVEMLTKDGYSYTPDANHDIDGGTDGHSVTIASPL